MKLKELMLREGEYWKEILADYIKQEPNHVPDGGNNLDLWKEADGKVFLTFSLGDDIMADLGKPGEVENYVSGTKIAVFHEPRWGGIDFTLLRIDRDTLRPDQKEVFDRPDGLAILDIGGDWAEIGYKPK